MYSYTSQLFSPYIRFIYLDIRHHIILFARKYLNYSCFSWPRFAGPWLHAVPVIIRRSRQNGITPARRLPRGTVRVPSSPWPHLLKAWVSDPSFLTVRPFVLQLQQMFQNHPDLREELERFRPPPPPVPTTKQAANNNIWPWVIVCAAVPLVAASLLPSLWNPVLWLAQHTVGEKMAVWSKNRCMQYIHYMCSGPNRPPVAIRAITTESQYCLCIYIRVVFWKGTCVLGHQVPLGKKCSRYLLAVLRNGLAIWVGL